MALSKERYRAVKEESGCLGQGILCVGHTMSKLWSMYATQDESGCGRRGGTAADPEGAH
jgi:hypothetical protein